MTKYIKMVCFLLVLSLISAVILTAFNLNIKSQIEQNKKQERLLHILKSMSVFSEEVAQAVEKDVEEFAQSPDFARAQNPEFAKEALRRERIEHHLKLQSPEQIGAMFENFRIVRINSKNPTEITAFTGKEFLNLKAAEINDNTMIFLFRGERTVGGTASPLYTFEVSGPAFWDKVSGYLTLRQGLQSIGGLSFYENMETPGLGKRIEQGWFQAQFTFWNKKVFSEKSAQPQLRVSARAGDFEGDASNKPENEVEAITGASETSRSLERFITADLRALFRTLAEIRDREEIRNFFDQESLEFLRAWHDRVSGKASS